MKNISVIVMALALLGVCSCKKSEKDEILTTADSAATAVRVGITNWTMTNGVNLQTNGQILEAAEKYSEFVKGVVTNDVYIETGHAGLVLKQIRDQSRLPGVSKDEHGTLTSENLRFSNSLPVLTYPALRTFYFVKEGETSTNNYTLVKQTKDSEWKLQKAWQTDSKGQIIQEWPVK